MANTTNIVSKIKILSFNCQSLKPKLYEIIDYLIRNKIDVACFNDTWLKGLEKITIPGYIFYRVDRQSGELGGVAIAVRSLIKHKQIPPVRTLVIENVAISVDTPTGEIVFVSSHFPGTDLFSDAMKNFKRDIRSLISMKKSYYV